MIIDGLPRPVKTILLDYDGTIIDIRPKWWKPVEKAFEQVSGFVPEAQLRDNVKELMQQVPSKPSRFFMLRLMWGIGRKGGLSRLNTLKFMKKSRENFEESRYLNIPIDGALKFIKTVRDKGIDIGIVTTASRSEIDRALSEIEEIDGSITISRDDVEHLKPHPEPINKAVNMLNAEKEHTVMIGDFSSDIEAGKNAGIMTIGLTSYHPEISKPGLENAKPDLLVPFLEDLLPRIQN